jgi:hypothetical protein
MFLIEPRGGGHYLVRNYDLVRDELMPGAVIDKLEGEWEMQGQPVARAVPAAGPWVYTLYRKDEGPFVHALNTEGYALCIDLPAAARSGRAAAGEWGLTLASCSTPPTPRSASWSRSASATTRASAARRGSPAPRSAPRRGWRSRRTAPRCTCPRRTGWSRSTQQR